MAKKKPSKLKAVLTKARPFIAPTILAAASIYFAFEAHSAASRGRQAGCEEGVSFFVENVLGKTITDNNGLAEFCKDALSKK